MWAVSRTQVLVHVSPRRCCLLRSKIVKNIDMLGIDMLFVVGGNGGNAGASAIQHKCEEQGVICSVIGIPKSIDNDILLVRTGPLSWGAPMMAARLLGLPAYRPVTC